ncbi:MAG: PorV/PorQ family protein, partial [Bacteroidota bacterium]
MMNYVLKRPALVLLMLTLVAPPLHAQAGKSGLAFLKLGISGRGLAMGDAMSAAVSGAPATYYNPAGLLAPQGTSTSQLMFMHKEWIQDTRVEFLGASIMLDEENAIGFSLNSTTVSDIEIRTRPGTPEGSFTARNFSLGASYARSIAEDLDIGITGKFLYQKILIDESSGFGIDLGAQYKTSVENLSVGAALANIGSMQGLRGEKTKLPTLLRIGPAYTYELVKTLAQRLEALHAEKR